ncbi:hypothetical protein [Pararhizobium qamdonense]|uniref:hypothetical protein n=1 Tax=Pararhizobium qamdonense TaxID=3031126 RepID=UPI0023E314E7|nr:hypothetical protein [Pararhizobium qamdonense]
MNDRRITTKTEHEPDNRLKHIAGLVKKLTFAEMNELAKLIHEDVDVSDKRVVPYGLLKIADRILETKTGISL